MAGTGSGDLYELAHEYLDACAAALVDTPVGGPPALQYVSLGPPAWDCEQLTVHLGGPAIAVADTLPLQPALAPYHRARVQGLVNMVLLTCTVLRCDAPVIDDSGQPPDAAEQAAYSTQTYADVWAILCYVNRAVRKGLLFASPSGTREYGMQPVVPVGIEGGIGGWQIPVSVQLQGYKPATLPPD